MINNSYSSESLTTVASGCLHATKSENKFKIRVAEVCQKKKKTHTHTVWMDLGQKLDLGNLNRTIECVINYHNQKPCAHQKNYRIKTDDDKLRVPCR